MIPDKVEPTQETNNNQRMTGDSPLTEPQPSIRVDTLSIYQSLRSIFIAALVVATVFTMWTPSNLFTNSYVDQILYGDNQSLEPTINPTDLSALTEISTKNHIGIIVGHWKNDSGATCPDGLREVDINIRIATIVKQNLEEQGFQVDLLGELDDLRINYEGLALISIHNDTCDYLDGMSGFKTAAALELNHPEQSQRLQACINNRYENQTGLQYLPNQITEDMSDYHAFREINPDTPALIIETGFMNADQEILMENTDVVAKGVSDGILCFLNNESLTSTKTTPVP